MHSSIKGSLWAVFLAGSGLSFASLVAPPAMEGDGPATPQLQTPQPMVAAPATEGLVPPTTADTAPAFAPPPTVADVAVGETAIEVDTTTPAPPPPAVAEAEIAPGEDTPADVVADATGTAVDAAPETMAEAETAPAAVPEPAEDVVAEAPTAEPVTEAIATVPAPVTEVPVDDTVMATEDTTSEAAAPAADTVAAADTPAADAPLVSTTEPEAAAAPLIVQAPVGPAAEAPVTVAEETPAPAAAPEPEAPVTADLAPESDAADEQAEIATDVEVAQATEAESTPTPSTPPSQIRINRPGAQESAPAGQGAEVVGDDAAIEDLPALQAHAAPFEVGGETPLVAVILIDDGAMPDAASAFADLGFSPTIALNALSGDAADKMQVYRAAGAEIALETGLPPMAQPTDLEVAFEAAFGILPEAALVFADASDMLLSDRDLTAQAMAILKAEGHGFVAVQRGLGSAIREAEEAGVPAATVERDIDDGTTDERAILRALDQAAFRARQSGEAVLLGRLQPATLNALRDWAAGLDPDQLQVAPVSAVLLRQSD